MSAFAGFSPAIFLTQSYSGKIVVTMLISLSPAASDTASEAFPADVPAADAS